jgi:phosphomannomutase
MQIDFGTDGWRARMDEDFTSEGVGALTSSICQYLVEAGSTPSESQLIVGYDTRKNSKEFASKAAAVANSFGFDVLMPERDTPTPAVANSISHWGACGGIMITASHNPPDWNGIKFIPHYAGPANEEITSRIQALVGQDGPAEKPEAAGAVTNIDPFPPYFEHTRAMLGAVALSTSHLKIVYDPMHGTGRGYVDRLLRSFGVDVETINDDLDPNFGGGQPDPSEDRLQDLKNKVAETEADIGLATDGDADRISAIGPEGEYFSPNTLFPLLASKAQGRKRGGIVRTVATTAAVDALAAKLKVPLYEVPVGFKYIAPYLMEQKAVIGGEESGGFGFWDHVPEKDAILSSLRIVELLAQRHTTMSGLLDDFSSEFGQFVSNRTQVPLTEDMRQKLGKASKDLQKAVGRKPSKVVRTDGLKLYFDDRTWILLRPSGTEPVARIYAEASSEEQVQQLLSAGETVLGNDQTQG